MLGAHENHIPGSLSSHFLVYRLPAIMRSLRYPKRGNCIYVSILTFTRESMGKTSGNRAEAKRQTLTSPDDVKKKPTAKKKAADGASQRETELRNELAAVQRRAQDLESANHRVAARLEAVIQSVKAILGKQG
jgi:hypothetical protein